MKITLDGPVEPMQPDTLTWEPPRALGNTGLGAPVYGAYWTCRAGFSRLTVAQFRTWFDLCDGATHVVGLPHPATGTLADFTLYVSFIEPRMDVRDECEAAMSGLDVTMTKITVT